MEYGMSQGFVQHPEFFEGIRALLVDKDKRPQWLHRSVSEVTQAELDFFFDRPEQFDFNFDITSLK